MILGLIALTMFLAFVVESLVEYFLGEMFNHVPKLKEHSWLLMYVAMGIGILGAFVYRLDLVAAFAKYLELNLQVSAYGIVLTGAAIGRGSNFIHELWSKFIKKSPLE